jgi:hypothetical protein
MPQYRKPSMPYFSAREAPDLYEGKEELRTALGSVAEQIARLFSFTKTQFYTHAMPEAIASLLDASDEDASIIAAVAYLESRGFKVSGAREREIAAHISTGDDQ